MDELLRIVLPIYFVVYFGIAFVLKSLIVAKRIGKNPLVLPKDDSAYGLIGRYFKLTLIAMFVYVLAYAFFPAWHDDLLPLRSLQLPAVQYAGLAVLLFALIWTIPSVAQSDILRDAAESVRTFHDRPECRDIPVSHCGIYAHSDPDKTRRGIPCRAAW